MAGMLHSTTRIVALVLGSLSLGGCTLPQPPPVIEPAMAGKAVSRVLQLNLAQINQPDSPTLANVLGTLSGSAGTRSALVVVFDSAIATRQLTDSGTDCVTSATDPSLRVNGRTRCSPSDGLLGTRVVRVANVVVLYRDDVSRAQVSRVLAAAAPR